MISGLSPLIEIKEKIRSLLRPSVRMGAIFKVDDDNDDYDYLDYILNEGIFSLNCLSSSLYFV